MTGKLEATEHYESLLRRMKPAQALVKLRAEGDDGVTLNQLYKINQRMGNRTNVDASETIPWSLRDKHISSAVAIRLRDLARLNQRKPLSDDPDTARRKRHALAKMILDLREKDEVIHYDLVEGFVTRPRRYIQVTEGVEIPLDTGWIRDPTKNDDGSEVNQWIAPEDNSG